MGRHAAGTGTPGDSDALQRRHGRKNELRCLHVMRQPGHDPAAVVGIERGARGKSDRRLNVEVRHEGVQMKVPGRQPAMR